MPEIEPQQPQRPDILDLGHLRRINGGGGPISSGGGGGSSGGGGQDAYPAHYTITLENFRIDQTWSFHHDTDYVGFGVKVGGQPAPNSPQHKSMGDLNNGIFSVGISYDITVPSADTLVVINYQIVNNGHDNPEQVMSKLDDGSNSMADDPGVGTEMTNDSSKDTGDGGSTWQQIVENALGAWLISLLTANCDALVAANQVFCIGEQLASKTANGPYRVTKQFTKASPHGCGDADSDYTITWSATRTS